MGTSPTVAYVWALLICLFCILISAGIAFMIPNKPGGSDIGKRRLWYWVIFVLTVAVSFGINVYIANTISIPTRHSAYMTAAAISTGVAALLYIIIGWLMSKGMSRTKLGSWF